MYISDDDNTYTNEQGVWKLILTWRAGILIQFKFVN